MKRLHLYLILVSVCAFVCGNLCAYEPIFKVGVQIRADGAVLDVGTFCVPNVYDWNNDGKKDLLVGVGVGAAPYYDSGKIRLYLNSGTDASPVFTNFSWIQAGGVDISHPFY
jgi:hypothetical protein